MSYFLEKKKKKTHKFKYFKLKEYIGCVPLSLQFYDKIVLLHLGFLKEIYLVDYVSLLYQICPLASFGTHTGSEEKKKNTWAKRGRDEMSSPIFHTFSFFFFLSK